MSCIQPVSRPLCLAAMLLIAVLAAAPGVSAQESDSPAEGYNEVGLNLFLRLAGPVGNFVLSPLSVGIAMDMAAYGASGETHDELARFLRHSGAPADAGRKAAAILQSLGAERAEGPHIGIANALHLTREKDLLDPVYEASLRKVFGAETFRGADLSAINGWAAEKTGGRIPELLDRIDPNSICVLANALNFSGAWEAPFPPANTTTATFHLSAEESTQAEMMRRTSVLPRFEDESLRAVALPYSGGRFYLIILVPSAFAKPGEPAVHLDAARIGAIVTAMAEGPAVRTDLTMPKFKIETAADLVDPLKSLGLRLPFDRDHADFSAMLAGNEQANRIHISQVRQKAVIDIDENGTEAAAGTAVEFSVRSVARPPVPFAVDRPFVFVIHDFETGAILFAGQVTDPTGR